MRTTLLRLIAVSALGTLAFAQDDFDPPGRAARLSYLSGPVSFQPGSVEEWVPATLNRPLTTGDRLWTESGARAEVHLGSAAMRLNGRTNFSFINLDDRTTQIQLSVGSLSVRVRRLMQDEAIEIDTPQVAFSILRPGEYRFDVNDQGDATVITVRGGEGEVISGGQALSVYAPEQVRFTGYGGDDAPPAYDRRMAPPSDAFENWCQERDRREDRSQSARYVSRELPGYADLDDYGVWREEPEYGAVWMPARVSADWAPYRFGHWAWIAPWGWTWVDDAPWGYAPFHYGRWVSLAGAWGWVPGPAVVRPVYAPAMVAWVGGPRFSLSVSVGFGGGPAVGWFPLAPREVWVPSYRASPAYFSRVNVSNTVVNNVTVTNVYNNTYVNRANVTNVRYINQNVNGAVTAVPEGAMVSGRRISQVAVRVPPSAINDAQIQHVAPIAPVRSAVLGGQTAPSAPPPPTFMNRPVVTRTPPPPAPVPFESQRRALQANPGQPLDGGQMRTLQRAAPPAAQPQYRPAMPIAPMRRENGGFIQPRTAQPTLTPQDQRPAQPFEPDRRAAPLPGRVPTQEQDRRVIPIPERRVPPPEQERRAVPPPEQRVPPQEQERRVIPIPERRVPPPEQERRAVPPPEQRVPPQEQDRRVIPIPERRVPPPEQRKDQRQEKQQQKQEDKQKREDK